MTRVRGELDYNPVTGQADNPGGISFTQYLLPRGERRAVKIHRPFAIQMKANEISKLGYKFECEILTNGMVSLTIAGKNTDVGIQIVPNGQDVLGAVDRLVLEFDEAKAKQMDKEAE